MILKKISFACIFVTVSSLAILSLGAVEAEWLGYQNETSPQNQEFKIAWNCGVKFERVYVPLHNLEPIKFTDLCFSQGKQCVKVCDWEGKTKSCNEISQWEYRFRITFPKRDGGRIALCE